MFNRRVFISFEFGYLEVYCMFKSVILFLVREVFGYVNNIGRLCLKWIKWKVLELEGGKEFVLIDVINLFLVLM